MYRLKSFFQSALFQNFFWNISGNVFSKGSVFIISIFVSRMLGIEHFGRLGIIQQTTAIFVVFSVLGLSITSLRFVAKNIGEGKLVVEETIRKVKVTGVSLSICMGIIFFSFSEYIADEVFNSSDISGLLKISSLVLVFNSLNQIQFGILSGLGQFKIIARTNVITSLLNIPLTFLLVVYFGLEGVVWSLVLNGVWIYLFNHISIGKYTKTIPIGNSTQTVKYKDLFNFSLPNLLASIVFSWASWYVLTLLTGAPNPLKEIAAYNSVNQVFAILYLIPIMLAQVVMSMTAAKQKSNSLILKKSIITTLVLILPFSFIMSLFSEEIMGLYGHDFVAYSDVLVISLINVVAVGVSSQLEHYSVAKGLVWEHLMLNVIFAVSFIYFSIYLLEYGALGIVVAKLLSYLIRIIVISSILRLKNVESEKAIPSQ